VAGDPRKETEELTLTLTRREYNELIDALKKAEELSGNARQHELDFRMQRIRIERKLRESDPPEALGTADTRFMSLDDIQKLQRGGG
jgi:hypothetical protein